MGKVPPDLFRSPNTLASLRPAAIQQHVQAQQQQHNSSPTANQPALLQRLQACLADAAATPKEAVHGRHAQQQLLHAYHQVFQLFLASMTTYRPLLLQIKRVYDAAVQDATAALSDNTQLQAKLSQVPHKQAQALATARLAGEQQVDAMEAELQNKLSQLQQQTQEVEAECASVEGELQHMQKHMLQAHRELAQLDAAAKRAYRELIDTSSWHLLAGS